MIPILVAVATFISTLAGGIVALKNNRHIHAILGFTAGVIVGVVAFDILPETFELIHQYDFDPIGPMIALVTGFLLFHTLEKAILMHHAHETEYGEHKHPQVGLVSALALSGHSFLDGIGIGLGFQVNTTVGIAMAIAVVGHDFADGLNTVSLMLSHKNTPRRSMQMLLVDALAPVAGAASTLFFSLSPSATVLYLGFFAGFLLYIGASDILPQAHEKQSSKITILLTIFGAFFIYLVTRLA